MTMNHRGWIRYVGWAGIVSAVYIVVAVAAFVVADFPTFEDPPGDVRSWLASDRAGLLVGQMATDFAVNILLFVPFVFGTAYLLEQSVPDQPILPRVSLFGGLLGVVVIWIGWMNSIVLYLGAGELSDAIIETLMRTDSYLFGSALNMADAMWIGAAGLAILHSDWAPHWLGWLGLGGAVALASGGLWILQGDPEGVLVAVGLLGLIALVVWMVGFARFIVRARVEEPASTPPLPRKGATAAGS